MTHYREILRLNSQGISRHSIAESLSCSRNTVSKILNRAKELNVVWPLPNETTDDVLEEQFFPKTEKPESRYRPDYDYIHKEMLKSGVTLQLLWNEYCTECRVKDKYPLMYTQFCHHYQEFSQKTKATMHIRRKPGEQIEVDWAGQTASVVDYVTGEILPGYIFVGVLSYSHYTYVEAFLSMDMESWIAAHVNMFQFFGGVARMLIPDNLKTGVDKISWYNPTINRTYHEMSEHYGTAVIPARVRKPKDKPNVEGAVGIASTWIIAALRNQKFFNLSELNKSIEEKLEFFNNNPFQKKEGCRKSLYLNEEKTFLLPLPSSPYELATWKMATVQFNYHISVDKMNYSVPYEYIKHQVDVRITHNVIEVFFHNHRICSHVRLHGYQGQYSTVDEHMPPDHKKYVEWNADRFISWAEKMGSNTVITVKSILSSHKIEQQAYRSCMGLLKLADKYSESRLEMACLKALTYTSTPSLKSIQTILATSQDKIPEEQQPTQESETIKHGFTRGADYYGRIK